MLVRAWKTIERLHHDEDGSSATEFAVLLPTYLLLFVVLLTLGQVVCLRQKVAMTVRAEAWVGRQVNYPGVFANFTNYGNYQSIQVNPPVQNNGQLPQGAQRNDFLGISVQGQNGGQPSQIQGQNQGQSPFTVDAQTYQDRIREPAPQGQIMTSATDLAWCAFVDGSLVAGGGGGNNNQAQVQVRPHLEWRQAAGQFNYLPGWLPSFFNRGAIAPGYACYVLGRKTTDAQNQILERKVYRADQGNGQNNQNNNDPLFVRDHHPIEDLPDGNMFNISRDPRNIQGPLAQSGDGRFLPPDVPGLYGPPNGNQRAIFSNEQGLQLQPQNITANANQGAGGAQANNSGLWDTQLRLGAGGDADSEHTFFGQQLGVQ